MRRRQVRFSIHASAKEATHFANICNMAIIFQSTPPRRRRHDLALETRNGCVFNPRLREGGDTLSLIPYQVENIFQSTPPRRRRVALFTGLTAFPFSIHASAKEATQHIVIPQLSCAYLVSTTFLSTIFSFISQYIVLFPLFRVRMPCVFCVAYDSHYVPLFNIFYILFQGTPF